MIYGNPSCVVEGKSHSIAVLPGLSTGSVAILEALFQPICSQFWCCGISSIRKEQKNNFAFTAICCKGKQAIKMFARSALPLLKPGRFSVGKAAIFCLKEIIQILSQFLTVTQSILNLISLGICCSCWPQTEFLCVAVRVMSTFIREQALREM